MSLLWAPVTSTGAGTAGAGVGHDELSGTAPRLALHEASRIRAAASHARRAVPGPLGEVAARELSAYADLGFRGDPDGLVTRLARQVLALPALPAVPP
jgi:hypothetical protein